MAMGLPEDLWKGGTIRPLRSSSPRKVGSPMVRLNMPLDPAKTGREAISLENGLRRMIVVGQQLNPSAPPISPRSVHSFR